MLKLLAAIRKATASKSLLATREGRFLTVYLGDGKRKNGKIIKPGYLRSTVQLAANGQLIKVRNQDIQLVSTDHSLVRF